MSAMEIDTVGEGSDRNHLVGAAAARADESAARGQLPALDLPQNQHRATALIVPQTVRGCVFSSMTVFAARSSLSSRIAGRILHQAAGHI
jgi:hypothetical protein